MELLLNWEFRQSPRILIGFVVGVGSAYGGATLLGWVTPEVGHSLARWLQPITSDARWALLVWLIVFAWITGPRLVERLRGASANALRLANEDAEIMEQRIQFYTHLSVSGEPKLTGTAPFIEFCQPMLNASVLPVTLEQEIEGRIYIDGEEQRDKLEFRQTPPQVLLVRRGEYHDVALKQWLSPEAVKNMQENIKTGFDFGHTAVTFGFEHRGQRRTLRKALGNQVIWENKELAISELLANARSREVKHSLALRVWWLQRHPENPTPPYIKSKLWFVFRNEGAQVIVVQSPKWEGLLLEIEPDECIQLEMTPGAANWDTDHELSKAAIEPGVSFRLWIGLHPLISAAELERKRERLQLGKLTIPAAIENTSHKLEYQV